MSQLMKNNRIYVITVWLCAVCPRIVNIDINIKFFYYSVSDRCSVLGDIYCACIYSVNIVFSSLLPYPLVAEWVDVDMTSGVKLSTQAFHARAAERICALDSAPKPL